MKTINILKEVNKLIKEIENLETEYNEMEINFDNYNYQRNSLYHKYFRKIYRIKKGKK